MAYLFIKRFYDLRVVSIYEFLDARFGHTTKIASSLLFIITRVLASGSRTMTAYRDETPAAYPRP